MDQGLDETRPDRCLWVALSVVLALVSVGSTSPSASGVRRTPCSLACTTTCMCMCAAWLRTPHQALKPLTHSASRPMFLRRKKRIPATYVDFLPSTSPASAACR